MARPTPVLWAEPLLSTNTYPGISVGYPPRSKLHPEPRLEGLQRRSGPRRRYSTKSFWQPPCRARIGGKSSLFPEAGKLRSPGLLKGKLLSQLFDLVARVVSVPNRNEDPRTGLPPFCPEETLLRVGGSWSPTPHRGQLTIRKGARTVCL